MEDKHEVLLLGSWYRSYCTRVELALKLKGIPYRYIEEDLTKKSELLLKYNPVHKKIPVLVHNGKPIVESLVILEYIDENWNHSPKLLPEDPYQRAKVRFWVNYYDEKIKSGSMPIILSRGKERKKAIEDLNKSISVFEEGIKKDFPEKFPFFNGDTLGLLDIVVGANACNYEAFEEVIDSEDTESPSEKNLDFFNWMNALKEHPLMKDTLPPRDKLVAKLKEELLHSPRV
ncbi:hypothetical protein L6164_031688 [Bauhinia variegata]|uniref:Uncharacterized protein n=1 Tax=Bauhinia variegata TaxID=167791 RepID=A0ACB9LGJ7_BAUVA|nr:hypothetical protein L6164_031688 [Bauhinia variegata]